MNNSSQYPKPRFLSIVIGIIGVLLLWMGVLLLTAGGSLYYAFAGVVLLLSAILLFRGDVRGAQLYGGFLLFTYIWALYESGLDAWALMPRVHVYGAGSMVRPAPSSQGIIASRAGSPVSTTIDSGHISCLGAAHRRLVCH